VIRAVTWVDADGNRYPLTNPAGSAILLEGAIGLDAAPVDVSTDERPGDGAALASVRAPAKTLALPLLFEDLDLLETIAETMIGRASTLEINNGTRARELVNVYYVGGLEGDAGGDRYQDGAQPWRTYVVELKALDPYWYGPTETLSLAVPTTPDAFDAAIAFDSDIPFSGAAVGISAGVAFDAAIAFDAVTPFDGGSIVTPPVTSRVGAWPVITVKGPATSFSVVHLRTGQRVAFRTTSTLAAGAFFVVDSRPTSRGVTRDGVTAWNMVTPDSDPGMQIKAGDSLSFILAGTDATSYINLSWRQRWRMP
jgi:hypothetical protein